MPQPSVPRSFPPFGIIVPSKKITSSPLASPEELEFAKSIIDSVEKSTPYGVDIDELSKKFGTKLLSFL
jgi:hypothetical protein